MPREKSRYRDRRSSSYSSESSYDRKKKSKHKRRSRSRDRSEASSHKRRRSTSRSRHKRKSISRSLSRDRYESRSKRRSHSKSKSKRSSRRSISRDKSYSRSSSRSRSKHSKSSKKSRKRSRSISSRSSEFDIEPAIPRKTNVSDTDSKIEKAIKAAEAAGITLTKMPIHDFKEVEIKEDMPTIHDRNLLDEINNDSFTQKSFTSSRSKKQNIVIDLNSQTVTVPESEPKSQKDDFIINFDELPNEEELKEMWIKKLYQYRKKMLRGEI